MSNRRIDLSKFKGGSDSEDDGAPPVAKVRVARLALARRTACIVRADPRVVHAASLPSSLIRSRRRCSRAVCRKSRRRTSSARPRSASGSRRKSGGSGGRPLQTYLEAHVLCACTTVSRAAAIAFKEFQEAFEGDGAASAPLGGTRDARGPPRGPRGGWGGAGPGRGFVRAGAGAGEQGGEGGAAYQPGRAGMGADAWASGSGAGPGAGQGAGGPHRYRASRRTAADVADC